MTPTGGTRVARGPAHMSYVALWQFMAFILLLCLIWVGEVLDLPTLLFGAPSSGVDIFRACLLSAATILCAIIAVGNTYLQHRHIIKGLLVVCPSCSKVKVSRDAWENLDRYLEEKTMATLRHDTCPDCYRAMAAAVTAANVEKWKTEAAGNPKAT